MVNTELKSGGFSMAMLNNHSMVDLSSSRTVNVITRWFPGPCSTSSNSHAMMAVRKAELGWERTKPNLQIIHLANSMKIPMCPSFSHNFPILTMDFPTVFAYANCRPRFGPASASEWWPPSRRWTLRRSWSPRARTPTKQLGEFFLGFHDGKLSLPSGKLT